MNPIFLYLISFFLKIIPVSRFFKLKNILYNLAGAKIDKTARIYSNVKIYGTGGLYIGKDTFIGHDVLIISGKPGNIRIGNHVDIAPKVYIGTGSHNIEPLSEHVAGKGFNKNIEIGDGCWIGANCTILPGVSIGKKSIIAAGCVVNADIPSFTITAGVPGKPIKKWNIEKKMWEAY